MSAANGVPTVLEKIAAALGFGASVGLTPDQITATQAGDNRDLSVAEQTVVSLFSPILGAAEQAGLADLTQFLTAVAGLGSVTSVSGAANIVNAALSAEAGVMQKQALSLGQTSVTTLISAALAKVGKVNLPLVG